MRLFALFVLPFAIVVPAASAATWQPPVVIAPASPAGAGIGADPYWLPDITTSRDARGDVAIAWTREDPTFQNGPKHVQVAVKLVGKAWTPPEEVQSAIGTTLEGMAMDGKGDVTLGYVSTEQPDPVQPMVRTRDADGTWGAPLALGVAAPSPNEPTITAIGADRIGDTLVIFNNHAEAAQSVFRPAGGAWQAPVVPGTAGTFAMSENGIATMVGGGSVPNTIYATRFTAATGWQAPLPVVGVPSTQPTSGGASSLALAVAGNGDATVAMTMPDGTLVSTSRAANAPGWTPLVTIGVAGGPGFVCGPLVLAVDVGGDAVVACPRSNNTGSGGEQGSQLAAVRAADGTWGPVTDVQDARWGSGTTRLAMADDGRALLLVTTDPPDTDHDVGSLLLEHLPGQGWKPATMPGFDASLGPIFFDLSGGDGLGILAVTRYGGAQDGQATAGLVAAELAVPSASVPAKQTHALLRVVGRRTCESIAHPCRSARTAHVTLRVAGTQRWLQLTIDRLRAGHWHPVRRVRVRVHGTSTKAALRLPAGRVRISTVTLHDARAHAWAAYLLVE
jgi:hypothetical protein